MGIDEALTKLREVCLVRVNGTPQPLPLDAMLAMGTRLGVLPQNSSRDDLTNNWNKIIDALDANHPNWRGYTVAYTSYLESFGGRHAKS